MRSLLLLLLLVASVALHANDTFRVGQQVLVRGDTATHAIDLLGKPAFKAPLENEFGAYVGESWQFRQDSGRVVTVTIIGGTVANIDESPQY